MLDPAQTTFTETTLHSALRTHYDTIFNQCLVLLVSFFASATNDMFRTLVSEALLEDGDPSLLNEEIKVTVGQIQEAGDDWSSLVSSALLEAKSISFQDMKSIGRAFGEYCGYRPERDRKTNNIILGQACRHAIVHTGAKVDDRLVRQVANAFPRDVKEDLKPGEKLDFDPSEIQLIGESMLKYLKEIREEAST